MAIPPNALAPVNLYNHTLVAALITILRDENTPPPAWRAAAHRLTLLMAYQATGNLPTTKVEVRSPLAWTEGRQLHQKVGLVPVVRAGLFCLPALQELLPDASIYPLGLGRNEETAQASFYYDKLAGRPVHTAFILDPMLATGGSAIEVVRALRTWGVEQIKLLCFFAAPEGVEAVLTADGGVQIYYGVLDKCLNERKYIVPGCGDAGDRATGVEC